MSSASADIAEAWQQRWPALRLGYLFASPGEAERGLRLALIVLECAAARFGVSDHRVASQKLSYWCSELGEFGAGRVRHPLLQDAVLPAGIARLPEYWLANLERARAETLEGLRLGLQESCSQACADPADALLAETLLAAYFSLAEHEHLPLAERPLALLLASDSAHRELSLGLAQALKPRWNALAKGAWQGRRGQRVLGLETLHWLGSDLFPEFEAGRLAALRRSWRAWRAVSGLA